MLFITNWVLIILERTNKRIEIVLCLEEFSINEVFRGIRLNVKMVDCKQNLQESESVLIKRAMAAKIGVEQTTG